MDPLTHGLIGMAFSTAGQHTFKLLSPVTVASTVGSIMPDGDIVFRFFGNTFYLKHHRGFSHSIFGAAIESAAAAWIINFFYGGVPYINILVWVFLGSMTHLIADIFNSYGARILWPFSKKMYSLSLLVITDPVIIILSLISIIISYKGLGHWGYVAAGAFAYILCRALMRLLGKYILRRKLSHVFDIKKIHLLPSMIAGHKLHYIVDDPNYRIIGEINLLLNKVDVSARLKRIDSNIKKHIMESKAARYFMEFTPIYHVNIEKIENGYKAILTDLRYVLRGEFLHHATIIYDNDMNIVDQKFNPYSLNTNLDV